MSRKNILFVVGVIPLVWVLGLLSLVIRARVFLGQWPTPHTPDPKNLPFTWHHDIVFNTLYAVLIGLPLFLSLFWIFRKSVPAQKAALPFGTGWALILLMTFFYPFNFVMWLLD